MGERNDLRGQAQSMIIITENIIICDYPIIINIHK